MLFTERLAWSTGMAVVLASFAAGCSTASDLDRATVAGRVHVKNEPLAITEGRVDASAGGIGTRTFAASESSGYRYVASVDSPVAPATGDILQATNFAFASSHAFVTYNMAGPLVEGALEIIDLTNGSQPQLVGSLVFNHAEFADVALVGTYALLAGKVKNDDGSSSGSLTVVDVSDRAAPTLVTHVALGSFYATSIVVQGTLAYVSTGDDGGIVRVDITQPAAPVVLDTLPLANALSVVRRGEQTFALGGADRTQLYAIADGTSHVLSPIDGRRFEAPGRMVFTNDYVLTNSGRSGLSVAQLSSDGQAASVTYHEALEGTGNGLDVAGNLAVLAQGEAGAVLYDVTRPEAPQRVGSFAFPGESGSANEVRFGRSADAQYIFLGHGLDGLRIVKIGGGETGGGAACGAEWWRANIAGEWWSAPDTPEAPSTSPGTWMPVPEEGSGLCFVETFVPTAQSAACSAIAIKRAIAIGPVPNEGQQCPVRCPPGTLIDNVHTRYGEASPLNDVGGYSCSGNPDRDSHEIDCDRMTDFCNGTRSSCTVTYHNSFCGDPWLNCIKSGRTKWQCIPEATYASR